MGAELGVERGGSPAPARAAARDRNRDHRFFTGMAIAIAVTVFVGFAPSYYLSGVFGGRPLPPSSTSTARSPRRGFSSSSPRPRWSTPAGPICIAAWAWPARYSPCCCW